MAPCSEEGVRFVVCSPTTHFRCFSCWGGFFFLICVVGNKTGPIWVWVVGKEIWVWVVGKEIYECSAVAGSTCQMGGLRELCRLSSTESKVGSPVGTCIYLTRWMTKCWGTQLMLIYPTKSPLM
jgi:hypothetical protein